MKLTDYLTKVQSQDERDRLVKKYSDDSGMEIGVQIGYDSRTADITRLCEIVKLLADDRARIGGLLIEVNTEIYWDRNRYPVLRLKISDALADSRKVQDIVSKRIAE